jgi:hypothetical protein
MNKGIVSTRESLVNYAEYSTIFFAIRAQGGAGEDSVWIGN